MRDLFRLLIVAAMSLAIVGITMIYSRGGDLNSAVEFVTGGISGAVANASDRVGDTPSAVEGDASAYTFSVTRRDANRWAGLAGFPDQAEVSFPLPSGPHYLSGVLTLDFDTQLTAHGDGLMTLAINGTTRGQVVLDSGRTTHEVRIDLTPTDLAGDHIALLMEGRGTTGDGQACPTDVTNMGSAVTLSAASRLELTADAPLETAISALLAAPQPFVLSSDAAETAFSIWANQQFNRSGIQSRLGAPGTGETAIAVSDHTVTSAAIASGNVLAGQAAVNQLIAAMGSATDLPTAWPVSVADLGMDTTAKTFRGSKRWTVPFNAADLPGGALPEQFSLRLATTPLAGDNDWLVRVTLNGNLIDTQRSDGMADTISRTLPLPTERLLPNNVLVVELVDTTPSVGVCARLPDVQAQMLPESGFADTAPPSTAWARLIEKLAGSSQISLTSGTDLGPVQAGQASTLLSMVMPRTARLSFDDTGSVALSVIDISDLGQQLTQDSAGADLKAILPAVVGGNAALTVVSVPSAEFGTALKRLGPDDVIILATGL